MNTTTCTYCHGDGWILDEDLNQTDCPHCDTTRASIVAAGVIAHGMHALGHHLTLHSLGFISIDIDAQAGRFADGTRKPQIRVHVSYADRQHEAWLSTVEFDSEHPIRHGDNVHRHRVVRLADTGVVINLLTVEPSVASQLTSITGGAA